MANVIRVFNTTGFKPVPRKKLINTVDSALIGENILSSIVKIIFVNDENIHDLNKRFLQHNRPTDVITFSLDENAIDGEIYISVDTAKKQAKDYKVTLTNEMMRLAVHGALHLAGYDDKTMKARKTMSELENKYISQI